MKSYIEKMDSIAGEFFDLVLKPENELDIDLLNDLRTNFVHCGVEVSEGGEVEKIYLPIRRHGE